MSARLLAGDAAEFSRVLSYQDDRHILEALLARVHRGESCWDVGASFGLYSVLLAKAVGPEGEVQAFEPEPRSYRRLLGNAAFNQLSNLNAANLALGERSAQLSLEVSEQAFSGTHALRGERGPAGTPAPSNYLEVEVRTGDGLVSASGHSIPSLVKIDVEGAEEEVLRGMASVLGSPACRTVVCEVHFALLERRGTPNAPTHILEILRGAGFGSVRWLDRSHVIACK